MADYIARALVADALTEWRGLLRQRSTVSPLRDLVATQAATIELRGAHPAGLAPLFAGRPTALSTLLREPEQYRSAAVKGRVILGQAEHALASTGSWTAALVVGTALWDGRETPILLRPVSLEAYREDDLLITLHHRVHFNPVFATELRERGGPSDLATRAERTLDGKEFDPRPLWAEVRDNGHLFPGLEVKERLLLGAFDDPEQRLLDDLDELDPIIGASDMVAAIAGDQNARTVLSEELPHWGAIDRDPFGERGVGDLDDAAFAVVDAVALGRSLAVDAPPGSDAVGLAVAIAADAAATGRTALVVGGTERALAALDDAINLTGADDLALVCRGDGWHADARKRLLASLTLDEPAVDEPHLRAVGDALVRARSEASARLDSLHRPRRPWGASVFEVVQAIVRLTASEPAPQGTARLDHEAVATISLHGVAHVAATVATLIHGDEDHEQADAPEASSPAPSDMRPWWHRVATDEAHGRVLDEALATLVRDLPGLATDAQTAHTATGLDAATGLAQWRQQVDLFARVQITLDTFSPAVFHRSLHEMVAATAPKGSELDGDLGRRERQALAKRAAELLRPGRSSEGLHEALVEASHEAEQWRDLTSEGGWPVTPDAYGAYVLRLSRVDEAWDVIEPILGDATGLDDADTVGWAELTSVLTDLAQDIPGGVDATPAKPAEVDPLESGLGELVNSLREAGASRELIRAEVEFAWWATAFDAMVAEEPRLLEHRELADAVESYLALDAEFGRHRIGPLMRAASEFRRLQIARFPDDARDLFATLMEGREVSVRELRSTFGAVTAALRPVIVAGAEQVPHVLPAQRCIDVLVVVGAEALSTAELIPALGRAAHVVMISDPVAVTGSAVVELAGMLPHLALRPLPQPRDPRVTTVLSELGYGAHLPMVPAPGQEPAGLAIVSVDAAANPVEGRVVVESSRAEVMAVVEAVVRAYAAQPERAIAVFAGNALHAARLTQELLEVAPALAARTPVVALGEGAAVVADHVVFSLGYARDQRGELPGDLGVLTSPAGQAALAQALVAGLTSHTVVTALDSAALLEIEDGIDDVAGTLPLAVGALRHLIDTAPHGAVPAERRGPGQADWLLMDMARMLRAGGHPVRLRYGFGSQAIALAVGGVGAGGYQVAVVTDELPDAPRSSVRDRLRWQQRRLEALGWRVLPLWTLDMFMDPNAVAERVSAMLAGGEAEKEHESSAASEEEALGAGYSPGVEQEAGEASSSNPSSDVVPAFVSVAVPDEAAPDAALAPQLAPTPSAESEVAVSASQDYVAEASAEASADAPTVTDAHVDDADLPTVEVGTVTTAALRAAAARPLIPTRAWDDTDEGWGERPNSTRDDEIRRDKPPHW